jgi:GINS complex subunit 4
MSSWEDEDSASAAATTDVELLKRAWRNDKAAPEILPFDSALVSRAREQIQLLVSISPLGPFTLLCTH